MVEYYAMDHFKNGDPLELNQRDVPPNDQSQYSSAVDAAGFSHNLLQGYGLKEHLERDD